MVQIQELPEADASPMEMLLGKELIADTSSKTLPTDKALDNKACVLLYFSASWCPVRNGARL